MMGQDLLYTGNNGRGGHQCHPRAAAPAASKSTAAARIVPLVRGSTVVQYILLCERAAHSGSIMGQPCGCTCAAHS